jgi:hypothetical protein
MGVSERTVRRIMQEDIRYKSYAMRRGQFMSEAMKIRRAEKAKKLLAKIKHPTVPNQLVFFSDEKNFSPGSESEQEEQPMALFGPN